jgi:hypothetical protein
MFGRATGCAGDITPGGGLAFEIGYTGDRRGVALDFTTDEGFGRAFPNWRLKYPLQGLWLGLSASLPVNERLSFIASGSWLVPSNQESDEEQFFTGARPTLLRNWRTSIQWYTAGAGAALSWDGPVTLLGGFRYDSFETNFDDPAEVYFVGGLPTDEADVRVNLYIPYVGLVARYGSVVRAGFIGFPYVPGHIRYGETLGGLEPRIKVSGPISQSYFFEAFAECGTELMGANIGFFAKWAYVHAKAGTDAIAEGSDPQNPENRYDSVDVTFDRRNWIVGGAVGLQFISPL